jgi:hypothetical protein
VTLTKYRPFLKERKDANNLHTTGERDASKTYAIFKGKKYCFSKRRLHAKIRMNIV